VRGVLPSTDWKRNAYKRAEQQKWYAGETISLGIGQGYNNFTMLQLASATATLAATAAPRARTWSRRVQDGHLGVQGLAAGARAENLGYKPENVAAARAHGGVTQEGTSRACLPGAPYLSGGKTGTAQAVSIGQKSRYNAARWRAPARPLALHRLRAGRQPAHRAGRDRRERRLWRRARRAHRARVFDYGAAGHVLGRASTTARASSTTAATCCSPPASCSWWRRCRRSG
jgi:penicillin-binding protein 2